MLLVTHVFPRDPADPAAPFLLRYAQGLVGAGAGVRVLAPHDPGLPEHHEVGGVPVRRVRYGPPRRERIAYRGEMHLLARRPAGAWRAARLVGAMARALRAEDRRARPDAVEIHWLLPGGLVARLARPRAPVQISVHGTDVALAAAGPLTRTAARVALGAADRVVAASEPLAAELRGLLGRDADAVAPMPPAAPTAPPEPPPGHGAILAVGRLVPEKGHVELVDAVAGLRDQGREVTLTVVGDGPDRAALAARAAAAGVPLRLPGAVSPQDLEVFYAGADVVAVPSRREGFGLVAVEALLRHRPVVATTAGGLAAIVTSIDGAPTGWSVPPADVPALRAALAEALDRPAESRRRAAAGARHAAGRWSAEVLGRQAVDGLAALARRAGRR